MHIEKNKKIFFYFFLFLIFTTVNNKYLNDSKFLKLDQINVYGLKKNENLKISKELEIIKFENLFFLDKNLINKILESYNIIENYFVIKRYPSTVNITLYQTNLVAVTTKDNKIFYVGTNGKLINQIEKVKNLPYIFGDFEINKFLKFKKIIDRSNFDYLEIENFFFFKSGRWDIETKKGVLIKLPIDNSVKTLNFIYKILRDENFENIQQIDARQKLQIVTK